MFIFFTICTRYILHNYYIASKDVKKNLTKHCNFSKHVV